jgi:V/A-type H+-transporting ATPase subunit B
MKEGIGAGMTRDDHVQWNDQMYAAYAEGVDLRGLVAIVGEEALSERDRRYLRFADEFERKWLQQGRYEDRDIEYTLDLGWELLSMLPESELVKIERKFIEKYHPAYRKKAAEAAEAA